MLPEKFKEKMRVLLGDGYEEFEKALTEDEPVRSFRISTVKVKNPEAVKEALADGKIPYEENGYYLKNGITVGRNAFHHAGAIYMQDPGAMAALSAVDIKKGARVIDLCAAPGGKSSKLAEAIGEDGFLVSNEYVPKRAKLLVGNLERLGIKNAIVTSLDTKTLAELFDGVFDLAVVDAPCSGEGMFRKSEEALTEWSEENVKLCQQRQREILNNAARLVKNGGTLLYSTCTFSVEENEDNVLWFLNEHEDFTLLPVKETLLPYTAPAVVKDGAPDELSVCARRFYPHIAKGEGQFVALFKKSGTAGEGEFLYKDRSIEPSKTELNAAYDFLRDTLVKIPDARITKQGENLVLISHGCPVPPKSVFLSGVLLGEMRGKLIFPSHHFFSAYGELFKNKIDLDPCDEKLEKYLRGEEIPAPKDMKGWCAVCVSGITIGGAKASCGTAKNHYPKGLRNKD